MNDSRITRRGFLTKAAAIAALPFVASAISSCSEDVNSPAVTNETSMSSFDSILNSKETVSVKSLEKAGSGNQVKLSNSLFYQPNIKFGVYSVLCKLSIGGQICLRKINVNKIRSEGDMSIVEELPSDAKLFVNPAIVIVELARISRSETRKRFRMAAKIEGGKI
jgi:hypothetical protein